MNDATGSAELETIIARLEDARAVRVRLGQFGASPPRTLCREMLRLEKAVGEVDRKLGNALRRVERDAVKAMAG